MRRDVKRLRLNQREFFIEVKRGVNGRAGSGVGMFLSGRKNEGNIYLVND
jgi:hypothetical protein